MRIYYCHYFNGVNQYYQNSLLNDSDLRITIKLKNFLFFTVNIYIFRKILLDNNKFFNFIRIIQIGQIRLNMESLKCQNMKEEMF